MAIYRFSAQVIGRSSGRSATAAAAYRAGVEILDERTGISHDYTRRSGVDETLILAPESAPSWAQDRAALWNAVESAEKRKDAQLCREVQLALPCELSADQRRALVVGFVRDQWVSRGMVADVALHAPDREGDTRNHHAHVMLTMRSVGPEGFGPKVREWNDKALLESWREAWQLHANRALELAGKSERIDHRTLQEQGIDRLPMIKLGPAVLGYERRTGEISRVREDWEAWAGVSERLRLAKAAGERERLEIDRTILDLSSDLAAAKAEQAKAKEEAAKVAAKEQAEQTRIERMSANELMREIGQLRPLPVKDLVDQDPALLKLRQELWDLKRAHSEAYENQSHANQEAIKFRMESPGKASLHDLGLWRSKELDHFEKVKAESERVRKELWPRIMELTKAESNAQTALESRLTREQAPVLARVSELMAIWNGKERQEQAERAKHYARDDAEKKFKKWASLRSLRSSGWGDRGEDWQALPPALREAIETYNTTPAAGKAAFLERLLSPQQVAEVDKLQKNMDRGRGR